MAEIVIQADLLTKSFEVGFKKPRTPAVSNLNLSIRRGQVVAFVGPNGAGKTTAIHLLLGLIKPTAGSAQVLGCHPGEPATRRHIGYQSEIFATYPFYTAYQALTFYGGLTGLANRELEFRASELLERLGLGEAANRKVKTFSKGMTQRLGLAQAMINDPQLLILDEPTTGLDPAGRKLIADIILEEKARGKTIFFSSHILSDVERVCDYLALIKQGQIIKADHLDSISRLSGNWEIEISGWSDALKERLQDVPYQLAATDDGYATLTCAAEVKKDLLKRLLELPVEIVRLIPHKQSLEALYMQLIGESSDA